MGACPACKVELEAGKFGEADVSTCPRCLGVLVAQRAVIPFMTALAKELGDVGFDQAIERVPPRPAVACPSCGEAMEAFGYLGTNLVFPQRCNAEWLLWCTPDVVAGMSLLFARTQARSAARQAARDEEAADLERRVQTALRARMRNNIVTRGFT